MAELFKGIAGSPITQLVGDITDTQVSIAIADDTALPDAPNLCTIGFGENIETIRYGEKSNGVLSDVTRGIEGTPRAWQSGTEVARFFTAHDHNAIIAELEDARLSDVKEKTFDDLKGRLEEIEQDHDTHLAEDVHQIGGVHGLEYEVGTWTPIFRGSTGEGTFEYATQHGTYTRIGKRVFIDCRLSITVKGSSMSGNVLIGGLPFSTKGETEYRSGGAMSFYSDINVPADKPYLSILALNNSSVVNLRVSGINTANSPLSASAITQTSSVIFSISYDID